MTTTQGAIRRLELLLARTPDMECADDLRFLLADYTLVIANYKTVCLNNEDLTQKLAEARRLLDDARAQKPLNESIRIVLREALMDGDRYTPQVLVNLDRALSKMRPLYAAPVPPAASTKTHQWEDDHCIKCGDSDWYAGPICSECKVVQPAAVPEAVAMDVSDSALLKAYTTETGKVLPHSWRPIFLDYARIGIKAALLSAADTEVKK